MSFGVLQADQQGYLNRMPSKSNEALPDRIPTIETTELAELFLDPKNPRLGRHNIEKGLSQDAILALIKSWALEELAVSFLESGFWPQEALSVVKEDVPGKKGRVFVVVEGNRRLAALKMLTKARAKEEGVTERWLDIVAGYKPEAFARLEQIPYIMQPSRKAVRAYLGYRHVTGIKEWNPAEKAEYIAQLIEEEKLTYDQVRKRIGSKLPTVRQNYISYRLLLQMEGNAEEIDVRKVEERFSVLYLSLRTKGVQTYLDIDIAADTKAAKTPVPAAKLQQLVNFAKWLFGTEDQDPIIADSRQVDEFGRILENPSAVDYLERNDRPSFSVARRMAGVAESEVSSHVERAADEIEEALKAAHQHKTSRRLQEAVRRVGVDALQLFAIFPAIKKEIVKQIQLEDE
jgi:hypothetical protein